MIWAGSYLRRVLSSFCKEYFQVHTISRYKVSNKIVEK